MQSSEGPWRRQSQVKNILIRLVSISGGRRGAAARCNVRKAHGHWNAPLKRTSHTSVQFAPRHVTCECTRLPPRSQPPNAKYRIFQSRLEKYRRRRHQPKIIWLQRKATPSNLYMWYLGEKERNTKFESVRVSKIRRKFTEFQYSTTDFFNGGKLTVIQWFFAESRTLSLIQI